MAHFAQIDENNIVLQVLVLDNNKITNEQGIEEEQLGIAFFQQALGIDTKWVQTSYNASFRKNYAGLGYTYDVSRDAFIPPKPFNSWVLNDETCRWHAPVPIPNGDKSYSWDEDTLSWILKIT